MQLTMRVKMKTKKILMNESVLELQRKGLLVMKNFLTVKMKGMVGEMFVLIDPKRSTRLTIRIWLKKKLILNVSQFYYLCSKSQTEK